MLQALCVHVAICRICGVRTLEPCVREPHIHITGEQGPGQGCLAGARGAPPMAGPGGPGDAGDGLGARRRRLFGRPAGRPDFTSPISSIFDGLWDPFFMVFKFLYKFSPIEFNTVFL